MKTLSTFLALSIGCLFTSSAFSPAMAASNSSTSQQAQRVIVKANSLYAGHQYQSALSLVNSALSNNASNPDLHYLRGVLLTATGQSSLADQEYQATLQLQPTEQVRAYCLRALNSSAQSMSRITEQVANQARGLQSEAVQAAATFNNDAAAFGDYEAQHAAQIQAAMSRANINGEPLYSAQDIQRVADAAARRSGRVANAAVISGADRQNLAQTKMQAAEESAQNLQYLMSEPQTAGTPHLNSLGTNYFVRNYGAAAGQPAPEVAKAGSLPGSMKAKQGVLPGSGSRGGKLGAAGKNVATVVGRIVGQSR